MNFTRRDKKDNRGLINNFFSLSFSEEIIPFETVILPLGLPALVYIFNEQHTIIKGKKENLKGLTLFGQFYGAYDYYIKNKSINIGINFKPTSFYKILNKDISLYTDKHILLKEINVKLNEEFEPLFINYKEDLLAFEEAIINFVNNLDILIDNDVKYIDVAVDYILKKEGLLKVNELLEILPFSQKSLEIKFKKIIGLTPVKYIKMIRFNQLMIKYQEKKINLNDLIVMFNYYDNSHFTRDFKLFMNQTPKSFFKKDFPLLEKYLYN